ncbi:MAG TPA: hypothetical protein VJZ49_07050 [Syntrophales bacterium]|nr:hypothetical protein [Syntrophales bacterium]
MKLLKHRFIILVTLLMLVCLLVQAVYAAEKIVQLNIPGCAS